MMSHTSSSEEPVIIVGAGMAGLSCAVHLRAAGLNIRLIDSGDGVGGRVRTDVVDGFLLDRGFQVYLDAYPETGDLLDLKALDLRKFEPGALIFNGKRLKRLMDVFRRPASIWTSATAPIGGFIDKLRVGLMRSQILGSTLEQIANREDLKTESYLRGRKFSEAMIDSFFRSFYGGIFLESELRTSSRMFEFTFKMLGQGSATLPAKGMGEIPKQLAARLPPDSITLNQKVVSLDAHSVTLSSGEQIRGRAVVLATNAASVGSLLPDLRERMPEWRSVTNLYFCAPSSPINESIICLNGSGEGVVNNVCALTDVSPDYSPDERALISVSVLGLHPQEALLAKVRQELMGWFGECVAKWCHLRTDLIPEALPEQTPKAQKHKLGYIQQKGIYVCGDHTTSASIEGAVISGKRAAEAIIMRRISVL
ncbi:MAG: NAD(P)/FAD-dependent oxidoreductase [Verrucomicrobiota bacterium]|nr:NAD(P)/FAD-dependent oxidoreductase [Verrucomicrobiota bacterium]